MLNLPLNYYLSITLAFTRDSQILFWNVSNFLWRYPTRVLPWGLTGKESSCSAGGEGGAGGTGDASSIPGSGRLQGEGNGNPLQYSCLENPMNRGAWWAAVHRVAKNQKQLTTTTTTTVLGNQYIFSHWNICPM